MLKDGRVMRADKVAGATDRARLAVANTRGRITLTRSFPWTAVRSIAIDGRVQSEKEVVRRYGNQAVRRIVTSPISTAGTSPARRRIRTVSQRDHRDRYPVPVKPFAISEAYPAPWGHPGCCVRSYTRHDLYLCPLPMEARVIGVRDDPLETYGRIYRQHFPDGVAPGEAGYILDVMRAKKAQEIYESAPQPAGPKTAPKPAPPQPMPGISPGGILRRTRPIDRIGIRAVPVNAQGKSDWDALDVELVAFDRDGRPVAIRGTVEWTLRGREQTVMRASNLRFVAMPGRVKTLATWTRAADAPLTPPANFLLAPRQAVRSNRFRLAYPEPSPAHDLAIFPLGELSARVLVPGQGTFVARQSGIPLRQWGPVRDGLVGEFGTLFLPNEPTYGRRRSVPHLMGIQSSVRPNHGILSVEP